VVRSFLDRLLDALSTDSSNPDFIRPDAVLEWTVDRRSSSRSSCSARRTQLDGRLGCRNVTANTHASAGSARLAYSAGA
jgi:hypothetical protein